MCSTPSLGRDQSAKSWFKKATYASWGLMTACEDGDKTRISTDKHCSATEATMMLST